MGCRIRTMLNRVVHAKLSAMVEAIHNLGIHLGLCGDACEAHIASCLDVARMQHRLKVRTWSHIILHQSEN